RAAKLGELRFFQSGQARVAVARWFDQTLQTQPWIAGQRFTIADITAFCALEFARGLMKFVPGDEGMTALQAWRDRMNERPSARV
ncbi:MAG: glutathione binding-like protein, partial [Rhodoferax sp.]